MQIADFVQHYSIEPLANQKATLYKDLEQLNDRLDLCVEQADAGTISEKDAWLCSLGEIYCKRLASRIAYINNSAPIFQAELTKFLHGVQEFFFTTDPQGFSTWLQRWASFPVANKSDNPNSKLMKAMAADLGVDDVFMKKQFPAAPPAVEQVGDLALLNQDPIMKDFLGTLMKNVSSEVSLGKLQQMAEQCRGSDLEVVIQNHEVLPLDNTLNPGQIQMKAFRCPAQSPFWRVELDVTAGQEVRSVALENVDDAALTMIENEISSVGLDQSIPSHLDATHEPLSRPPTPQTLPVSAMMILPEADSPAPGMLPVSAMMILPKAQEPVLNIDQVLPPSPMAVDNLAEAINQASLEFLKE